jgi:hypothetical protein
MAQTKAVRAQVGRSILQALRQSEDNKRALLSTHLGSDIDGALVEEYFYRGVLSERGIDVPDGATVSTSTDGEAIIIEGPDGTSDRVDIEPESDGLLSGLLG